jgi:hypothetical protein
LSQELEAKRQELDDEYARSLESTCMACEMNAKKEIAEANQKAEQLQNIPDSILQDVVREYLQHILPAEKR